MSGVTWWGGKYSTDEQVVGTWIDGKPVYQKMLQFGDVAISSEQSFPKLITYIPDLEHIVDRVFYLRQNSDEPIFNAAGAAYTVSNELRLDCHFCGIRLSDMYCWAKNYNGRYTATVWCNILYTKTTD